MKSIKWIFKIGWKVSYRYVNNDIVETTWFNTKTKETKVRVKKRFWI